MNPIPHAPITLGITTAINDTWESTVSHAWDLNGLHFEVNHDASTLSSAQDSVQSKNWFETLFSPLLHVLTWIKNKINRLIYFTSNEDTEKLLKNCKCEIENLKNAMKVVNQLNTLKTNAQFFYKNLTQKSKTLLDAIIFKHSDASSILVGEEQPRFEKMLKEDAKTLEGCCETAIKNLNLQMALLPFTESLLFKNPTKEEVLKKFNELPKDAQELIKYTIWKKLAPTNNNDSNFGQTILNNNATSLFVKAAVVAVHQGLENGEDGNNFHTLIPNIPYEVVQ